MDPKQRLLAVSGGLVQLQQIVLISVCVSVWGDVWMHSENTLLTHPVAHPKPTGLLNPVLVTYYPWQLIGLINSLRMAISASAAGTKFHTLSTLYHSWLELIGLWWMYQAYNRNKKSLIIHHCNRLQKPENKEKLKEDQNVKKNALDHEAKLSKVRISLCPGSTQKALFLYGWRNN